MKRLFRSLLADRSGNFSQIFGIMLLPALGSVGLAVDYSYASLIRSQLYGAADAAAVGSIADGAPALKAAALMSGDGPIADGRVDAINLFNGYLVGKPALQLTEIDAEVVRTGTAIASRVEFTANVPMPFMSLFGHDHVTVTGAATAQMRTAPFMDFYLLLDNTPSMGVGATPTDVATMVANTPDQCAFACHDLSRANNYYHLAKSLGVTMRIDVVRQATQQLTETAKATRKYANQFRMGVYTFGAAATAMHLTEISPLTTNMDMVKANANAIDLMTIPHQNYNNDQQTDYDTTMAALNARIDAPGNGESSSQRQKIVFFVSDGVGDSYKPSRCTEPTTGGRCQEPIDVRACQELKARG
ncbi:MAG: Tad domain-containing protein, partial [Mesorhizobium sp.]|nr:Tad domain-containing protein [Mesorhizobium sp.]